MAKKESVEKEIEDVEKYEYLLVEYIKEISNGMTCLVMIVTTLFLFVLLDLSPQFASPDYDFVRLALILAMIGGLALFGISSLVKRKLEKKFKKIFP